MELAEYRERIRRYASGERNNLNLSSNFQIGLGIDHARFCDAMTSSQMFRPHPQVPEYNPYNCCLLWHEGVLELRVMDGLGNHVRQFPEEIKKRLQITVQTNDYDGDRGKIQLKEILQIRARAVLALVDFSEKEKIALGIPDVYYNAAEEQVIWMP